MDKLVAKYSELVALFIDMTALTVSNPAWFRIQPDASTQRMIKKQRMVCRQLLGGLRMGVETLAPLGSGVQLVAKPVAKVASASGNPAKTVSHKAAAGISLVGTDAGFTVSTLSPFISQGLTQVFTFQVELLEPSVLDLIKDPASSLLPPGLTPGQKPLFSNSKGQVLQPSALPFTRVAFTYVPKATNLARLEVQNLVTRQIIPQPLVQQGANQMINTAGLDEGPYQVLENGTLIQGTEYYQLGYQTPALYAVIQITTSPAMLNVQPANRLFTLNLKPK